MKEPTAQIKKTNWNWDITIGVIIGVILTIFGSYLQFHLQKKYLDTIEKKQLATSTAYYLDSRLSRSSSIILNSGSSVFNDRWDAYISEIINPWNANLFKLDRFINENHSNISIEFDSICNGFRELHSELLSIRRLQKAEKIENVNKLKDLELQCNSSIKILTIDVLEFKDKILRN